MATLVGTLDRRLRDAGIPIYGVSDNGNSTYRVDFKPEATAQQQSDAAAIVAAFDPVAEQAARDAAIQTEQTDLSDLLPKITTELDYITTTLAAIDTMTAAQVREVVKRILLEQRAELKAWRYVIRQLAGSL